MSVRPELRYPESLSSTFSPTSLSHQQVSLMHVLAVTGRAGTSVPGTRGSSRKPGQDWRQEASVVVVLGSRLEGVARAFSKFGLAVQDLNFYPYLPIEMVSHGF